MRAASAAISTAIVVLCAPSLAQAATFYVSGSGSDANAGTSAAAPWRTVAKVNAAPLAAGDKVLFEGSSTFAGQLAPPGSGAAGAPITFASYGTGRANLRDGIAVRSDAWLVFDNLRVDPGVWQGSTSRGVMSSSSGTGASSIVVQNCVFANVLQGFLLSNHGDRDWTIRNNSIRYTRDSGAIVFDPAQPTGLGGDHIVFEGNVFEDTGLDPSFAYPKHGIYSKGTNMTMRNNTFRHWNSDPAYPSAALSIRGHNGVIEVNNLSDGPYGIVWSSYDTTAGVTRVAYNRISGVTQTAIELPRATGPVSSVESFVVVNNTIATTSAPNSGRGIFVQATTGFVKLANNIVTGSHYYGLWVDGLPTGGFSEKNDLWDGNGGNERWNVNGAEYTSLLAYQAATLNGAADRVADPLLDTTLTPATSSPAVDAGTTGVDGSVTYVADCGAALFHYCGNAPDAGAAETSSGGSAPPPPPPPSPPVDSTGPSLAFTSPADGSKVPASFVLAATASDPSGVASVAFSVDGIQRCVDISAPYGCSVASLAPGWHSLNAVAKDVFGNASSATIRVKVTARLTTTAAQRTARTVRGHISHRARRHSRLLSRAARHRARRLARGRYRLP